MAIWKYSGQEVCEKDIVKALKAVSEVACFKCWPRNHSKDCPIFKLIVELNELAKSS